MRRKRPGKSPGAMITWLQNGALVCGAVLIALVIAEVVFYQMVMDLPLFRHHFLSDLRYLTQTSKAGPRPDKDYVLILGDSYAQGAGDWLYDSDPHTNPPFHSAHVIHDRTGRDIVTLGFGGGNSFNAYVEKPLLTFRNLDQSPWYRLPRPSRILLYFYEGNDFEDNPKFVAHMKKYLGRKETAGESPADLLAAYLTRRWSEERPGVGRRLISNSLILQYIYRIISGDTKVVFVLTDKDRKHIKRGRAKPGKLNKVLVGGRARPYSDDTYGPALGVDEGLITLAVAGFSASVERLKREFKDVPISVVYIPAPLTCYRLATETVSIRKRKPTGQRYRVSLPAAGMRARSDRLAGLIGSAAKGLGVEFLDSRPDLYRAAEEAMIHGPIDPNHLNKHGYEVLGRFVAGHLEKSAKK